MPVDTLLTQRIAELTMHGWDIRSRLEGDYHLSDGAVAALLDTVDRAARRAFRPDPSLAAHPIRYRFLLDRPESRVLDLVLSDREAEMMHGTATEPPAGRPDVVFRCDGEACVLIMYGRLTPDRAPMVIEGKRPSLRRASPDVEFRRRRGLRADNVRPPHSRRSIASGRLVVAEGNAELTADLTNSM